MRAILGALTRCATWYVALFWTMTYLLGISRTVAAVAVPFIIVTGVSLGSWRFYRGIHRREGTAGQARFRGPVRRAGAAGPRCRARHRRCACPRCAGPGLSQGQISRQIMAYLERLENIGELSEPLPGGIRLKYVPAEPLQPGGMASNQPPRNNSGSVSGSGYTRGGQAPAHVRSAPMNQPPVPGPLPHPVTCQCVACMPAPPPSYVPPARPKPRTGWGMDGFDGAPLVAGTALGYRWWTLRAPQLHRSPADADREWDPGLLRGVKDFWQPGVNQARCLAPAQHSFELIPYGSCSDGFWAYWEIQQHDMGVAQSLPVVGVVKASGQVIMGPRGFRAQKAEIVALHLPFKIQPDLPAACPPAEDSVTRALRGQPGRTPARPWTAHPKFTGRVINFPGAPPVPPSLGGPVPTPTYSVPPPEPEPPTQEEIRAAADRSEAWMAVIADRLQTTYPGAEVCTSLGLMKAKYPVKSEYAPPEPQVTTIPCPYCGTTCDSNDIHMHVVNNHYF